MPKYTTPQALWETITGLQSVGGTQFEGNTFINETLRYVDAKQGIDVEYKNRLYGDGMDADGVEQLETPPLPVSQQSSDVVEDRDKRKSLGTFPISNRGFWEDINLNPSTLQPYLTSDLRKTVKTEIVSIPDEEGSLVYKEMRLPDQIDRSYSIDALPFVTDPNNDDEIIRVDRYYDREINPNEYKLTTEGKVNYFLYPRESGRLTPKSTVDIYKSRNKKNPSTNSNISSFDNAAANNKQNKNFGYFVFNLDWGDGTSNEHDQKPKLLESSVIFDHTYEKPGFYTITGTVFLSYGFRINQYERFETRIFLNPSKKYNDELDLLRNRNFAMIGGISTSSTLVKSVSSAIGLDPFDFSKEKTKPTLLEKYNELDTIELLNFMNMIDSNTLTSYQERYVEPYSKVIDDEPISVLEVPILRGCLDPNADNTVEWATINQGCKYSYKVTGNINGLGGQQPLFFLGEYGRLGQGRASYYLRGGAYADWNEVITEISSDDLLEETQKLEGTLTPRGSATQWTMSGINNDTLKNLLSVEMSMTIKNPLTDEGLGSYTITNLGVNDSVDIFPAPTSDTGLPITSLSFTVSSDSFPTTHGKFALIVAPSTIYPELGSSDDVPFDGWTIPDGLRIGKINYFDDGTPIIEQTSGNDLPGTLSGQGFGYQIDTPIDPYSDVDGTDRLYILTADPDNPPSETNYGNKELLVNWSGDTEDTGDLQSSLGETLFYATVQTEVMGGDGTLSYIEDLAYGQDGVLTGDTLVFEITPSTNQRINHLYYNGEEVLPGDSRIISAYNLAASQDMPAEYFYETSSTTGLDMWGEDVRYTLQLIADTNNLIEVTFSEMSAQDEVFGNNTAIQYQYINVAIFNSPFAFYPIGGEGNLDDYHIIEGKPFPKESGIGPSAVGFGNDSLPGIQNLQVGTTVPSAQEGAYSYRYNRLKPGFNTFEKFNRNYSSLVNDKFVHVDNQNIMNSQGQTVGAGPYRARTNLNFINNLNEIYRRDDFNGTQDSGFFWRGWFKKSPLNPEFDIDDDFLSSSDVYDFPVSYNEGIGANNEAEYFPYLIEDLAEEGGLGNAVGPTIAVFAYVEFIANPDFEIPLV